MESFLSFFQLAAGNVWLYGVTFLVILSILVFIHEWGHYIVARLCGVRVEIFSIGFGPELFGWNDSHGTRWKFSAIPLGGYVKMFGDVDPASAQHDDSVEDETGEIRPLNEEERKVAFFTKSVSQRAAIVFAGPAINFLFALIILTGLYTSIGKMVTPPVASAVEISSPADKAGLRPHDRFLSAGGIEVQRFADIRRRVMLALDTELPLVVERDGSTVELTAQPERLQIEDHFGFKHERGYLGIVGPSNGFDLKRITSVAGQNTQGNPDKARELIRENIGSRFTLTLDRGVETNTFYINPPVERNKPLLQPGSSSQDEALPGREDILVVSDTDSSEILRYSLPSAVIEAVIETYSITADTLKALGQMVTGTRSPTELGGVIRIGAIAGDMAQQGLIALITFTALLSINLGLINLFPIPMLDGGHLMFYAAEAIKGRPLSDRTQEYAFRMGLVVLIGLMLFANLNDLFQIMS